MAESDATAPIFKSSAEQLSKILHPDPVWPEVWNEEDMAAMLRHQLGASLAFDLGTLKAGPVPSESENPGSASAAGLVIKTFEDLLVHSKPPPDVLRLAKDFFKRRTRECEKHSADWQVAYFCYLLCVVAAEVHGIRLSNLKPDELHKGLQWALERNWGDSNAKKLINRAIGSIKGAGAG